MRFHSAPSQTPVAPWIILRSIEEASRLGQREITIHTPIHRSSGWEGTRDAWQRQVATTLLMSQDTLGAQEGAPFLKGGVDTLKAFSQYFDPIPTCPLSVTVLRS